MPFSLKHMACVLDQPHAGTFPPVAVLMMVIASGRKLVWTRLRMWHPASYRSYDDKDTNLNISLQSIRRTLPHHCTPGQSKSQLVMQPFGVFAFLVSYLLGV